MLFPISQCYHRFSRLAGITLTAIGLSACGQPNQPSDSSDVVVQLGRGVSNVCEIGMTFAQIKTRKPDASTHGIDDNSWSSKLVDTWRNGRFVLVPSIAAIAYLGTNQPIAEIEFHAQAYNSKTIPGLQVLNPFKGKIDSRLSFRDGPAKRLDVEAAFGRPQQGATNGAQALDFLKRGEAFWRKRSEGIEELCYPPEGVCFVLERDVVASFTIYRKRDN